MFAKGKSGNPGGRPKAAEDITALARSKSKANLERIIRLAESAEDEAVQLRACQVLHEIAWGKPAQAVTGSGGGPIALTVQWLTQP